MRHYVETLTFEQLEKACAVIVRSDDPMDAKRFADACRLIVNPEGKKLPTIPIILLSVGCIVSTPDERAMNKAGWFHEYTP